MNKEAVEAIVRHVKNDVRAGESRISTNEGFRILAEAILELQKQIEDLKNENHDT